MKSCSYTYLLAASKGSEALIIDPVYEKTDHYLEVIKQLDLKLVKAIDTHLHADHRTALGALRDKTKCITVMGKQSDVDVVSMRVEDGDTIQLNDLSLEVIYTPGHTNDSYSFYIPGMIFTGDSLLIKGTGRTDFQGGNPRDAYKSIFNKLLKLPEETIVYPGHDYKGDTSSTIGEEKKFNPRLQVKSELEYASLMDNLDLPNPKLMDLVLPENSKIGLEQKIIELPETNCLPSYIISELKQFKILFVDLRETTERKKNGVIPNSVHIPYTNLEKSTKPDGLLSLLVKDKNQPFTLYCSYGERSIMAIKEVKNAGYENANHIKGGFKAWVEAGGPTEAIYEE